MRTLSLADAGAHLSEIVSQAEAGEESVITRRGRPHQRLSSGETTPRPPRFSTWV